MLPRGLTCFVRSVLENVSAVKVSIQKDSAIESCKVQLWSINCKNEDTRLQINVNHLLLLVYFRVTEGLEPIWTHDERQRTSRHTCGYELSFFSFFLHIISYILGIMLCAEIMSTHIQRCHIYNTEKQTLSVFSKASGLMGSFAYLEYFWAYGNIFWFSRAKCQLSLVSCVSED